MSKKSIEEIVEMPEILKIPSLNSLFWNFVKEHNFPKIVIKRRITRHYIKSLTSELQNYNYADTYFERIYLDHIDECVAVREVSGVKIPNSAIKILHKEAIKRNCPYLALKVEALYNRINDLVVQSGTSTDVIPRQLPIEALNLKGVAEKTIKHVEKCGGIESLEKTLVDSELNKVLAALPKDRCTREQKIRKLYRRYAESENSYFIPFIGSFLPFFSHVKRIYEVTKILPHTTTVQIVYKKVLTDYHRFLYQNSLAGLLWLREITGIVPNQKISVEGFETMSNAAFNLSSDVASRFEMLEKITGLKAANVFAKEGYARNKLLCFYFSNACDDHISEDELKRVENVTGVQSALTTVDFQKVYLELFNHIANVGLRLACKKYDKLKIKPSDEFFMCFLNRYARK